MKNKMKVLGLVLLFTSPVFGFTDPDTTQLTSNYNGSDTIEVLYKPILITEKAAQFPGGEIKFEEFIVSNIKYPTMALHQGIEGKVIAMVTINEGGTISRVEITEGIGGGCDEEVIRVLSSMPTWEPAIKAGVNITTKKKFAFAFKN